VSDAPVPIRRALVSVSDKTGLVELARALERRGVEIISTGGTARALREAGVMTTPIEEVTGFPEIMGGRVKTLHPLIHGGLLALLDEDSHRDAMRRHRIDPIDLVVVNLYPFEETIARDGVTHAEAVEQIDIGGPSMVRSAAKNAHRVTVLTSPDQYGAFLESFERDGATTLERRMALMRAAFERTSAYDAAIAAYLSREAADAESFPRELARRFEKVDDLRYGENPHQAAALYRDPRRSGPSLASARQLHGKPLSYNNVADAAAALELVIDLRRATERPSAAVIKHANPCGAASAGAVADAARLAMEGDPLAAFGGIVALSDAVTPEAARVLATEDAFLEVIVAPRFEAPAMDALAARWANVRLLEAGDLAGPPGGGKTPAAKAAAAQTQANFISIKGPELMSRYVGDSEARLREVFRKARQAAPCLVFFDEIDSLLPRRGLGGGDAVGERVLAQFLAEMDGVEELTGVLVLGATNRLDLLDPAMLRPGRFDEIVEFELPDLEARSEIFAAHLRGRRVSGDANPRELAALASGLSGAQIAECVRRAAMEAVRRVVREEERSVEIRAVDLRAAVREEAGATGEAA